jgi:hypothetical protein
VLTSRCDWITNAYQLITTSLDGHQNQLLRNGRSSPCMHAHSSLTCPPEPCNRPVCLTEQTQVVLALPIRLLPAGLLLPASTACGIGQHLLQCCPPGTLSAALRLADEQHVGAFCSQLLHVFFCCCQL